MNLPGHKSILPGSSGGERKWSKDIDITPNPHNISATPLQHEHANLSIHRLISKSGISLHLASKYQPPMEHIIREQEIGKIHSLIRQTTIIVTQPDQVILLILFNVHFTISFWLTFLSSFSSSSSLSSSSTTFASPSSSPGSPLNLSPGKQH